MLKHIIGQAIYEFVILLIIIFYGEFMIPEYLDTLDSQILKDNNSQNMKYNIVDNKCNFLFKI